MGATDIPGASQYGSAVELAKARYQQRLADINKQRQSTMRTAGFTGDIDANSGLLTHLRTDPYNQYGQYQLLNRSQAQRAEQTVDENIGRGLGHGGGLAAQNLGAQRFAFGNEDANFGSSFADQLAGLNRDQQDELYQYNQALWQAQQLAAQTGIDAGDYGGVPGYDYPPAPYVGGGGGGGLIPGVPKRPAVLAPSVAAAKAVLAKSVYAAPVKKRPAVTQFTAKFIR